MGSQSRNDIFATTRWSVVLNARDADGPAAAEALTELCRTYWFPLYAYARGRGFSPHDAEDLTQGFFAKLLRLDSIAKVSPEKGRFRAFLLAGMKNFVAEEARHALAEKRDARRTISLDAQAAEEQFASEPSDSISPERLFERQWALTLLQRTMERLAGNYGANGRAELFEALRFSIAGEKNAKPYRGLAKDLGMTEEAVRVAVFRLRKDYRRALRDEIAQTVADPAEIAEELQALRRILAE